MCFFIMAEFSIDIHNVIVKMYQLWIESANAPNIEQLIKNAYNKTRIEPKTFEHLARLRKKVFSLAATFIALWLCHRMRSHSNDFKFC
jgi:hypothetical protein